MRLLGGAALGMVLGSSVSLWSWWYLRGVPVWRVPAEGLCQPEGLRWRMACGALSGGVTCGLVVGRYGWSLVAMQYCLLAGLLLFLSQTDRDDYLIPNGCIACAVGLRLICMGVLMAQGAMGTAALGFYGGSALAVGLALLATVLLADRLLGRDSLGGGDLKLYAVCALYVGWEQSLAIVACSCLLGLFTRALRRVVQGPRAGEEEGIFPLGPSIAVACLLDVLALGA